MPADYTSKDYYGEQRVQQVQQTPTPRVEPSARPASLPEVRLPPRPGRRMHPLGQHARRRLRCVDWKAGQS